MGERRTERGQALLELAIILPVLLILLMGLVEIGFALRDYLIVVNATREGCRFAARGRFDPEYVGQRVISAGGIVRRGDPPQDVQFLRTGIDDSDPNTAIIVTNIPTDDFGDPISYTVWVAGVFPDDVEGVRPIQPSDTTISETQVVGRHAPATQDINAMREAAGYERMGNHIVVVEVFFMHHPLWSNPFVWRMHAKAEMRVVSDREAIQ